MIKVNILPHAVFAQIDKEKTELINQAARKVALEIFLRVVRKTPVDTGMARGSWVVSLGKATSITGAADKSGSQAVVSGGPTIAKWNPLSTPIYFCNNLPYAKRLDDGWSKMQAPDGMIRPTLAEMGLS